MGAQTLAALALACSGVLLAGHLLSTTTFDLCFWTILGWLVVRLVRTGDTRLWLVLGPLTGIALLNKYLVLEFWVVVLAGLLLSGHRRLLRSRSALLGALLALAIWAPNLAWQAHHGWPQLHLAQQIGGEDPVGARLSLVPIQFLLIGPIMSIVWIVGLRELARSREQQWIAIAYILLLGVCLLTGGHPYYTVGLYPSC
jgi:hypothetical protein